MADTRVTSLVVEVMVPDSPDTRVTSLIVEVLAPDTPDTRVTSLVVEVMISDPILQYLYPDGDTLSGGWETAPTSGQDLNTQIDEDPPVDTDYIFEDV